MKNKKLTTILTILFLSLSLTACNSGKIDVSQESSSEVETKEEKEEETETTKESESIEEEKQKEETTKETETEVETTIEESKSQIEKENESQNRSSEIKDDKISETKPIGTTAVQKEETKPVETTSTPKAETKPIETTAAPEPHIHSYTEMILSNPSCSTEGQKQIFCSCGESRIEKIPATGNHQWVEEMTEIEHEALGHIEQVQVGSEPYSVYECGYCGHHENSPEALENHAKSYIGIDNEHVFSNYLIYDYEKPIYENKWIVDKESYTEKVGTGKFTCSICGITR